METQLDLEIKEKVGKFLGKIKDKEIQIISHFDTDGITSAAIMIQALKKLDQKFSVKILKNLEKEFIYNLPKDKIILLLDLGSGSLEQLGNTGIENIFIIDHHQVSGEVPSNVEIINPELNTQSKISASGLVYLFCKEISEENKEFAKLAILGMIGDRLEKEVGKLNNGILDDGDIKRKRGLLIYPSTRPLNRTLEYCSNPYIPDVTGNVQGVFELLREVNLVPEKGPIKSIIELNDEEMEKLVTAITLRTPKKIHNEIIGDIFLIKLFNKVEDARELSAMINACSRLGKPEVAIQICMEVPDSKKRAEAIHVKYKQHIISGLKVAREIDKIEGRGFTIINTQNKVKETIIGTIASIISSSTTYVEGTVVATMGHYEQDKIKISLRNAGNQGRDLKETISRIMENFQGEVGGHTHAAGALIQRDKEQEFIQALKKHLEVEVVKV